MVLLKSSKGATNTLHERRILTMKNNRNIIQAVVTRIIPFLLAYFLYISMLLSGTLTFVKGAILWVLIILYIVRIAHWGVSDID